MQKESVLLKKPNQMSLIEYFDTLDPFDKRHLLDELERSKDLYQQSLNGFKPWFGLVIFSSVFGIISLPNVGFILYFCLISGFMSFLFFKRWNLIRKFKMVIRYLTQRLT
jgi:hypothetical protein